MSQAQTALEKQLASLIQNSVTPPFKTPLRDGALFALLVLPVLGLEALFWQRRRAALSGRLPSA